jgi:hypothetical protein
MTLDRYLKDVRTFLPAEQADDIVNELSENLRAQFEDREAELGRPLTDAELEEILNAHGKPLMVAARYRNEEQSFTFGRKLIGPALFPSYLQVLSITFSITLAVIFIGAVVAEVEPALGGILSSIALAVVIQFGVITGIFMAADRAMAGEGTLPADIARSFPGELQRSFPDRVSEHLIGKPYPGSVPRRTSVADFALSAITLGWLYIVRPPNVTDVLRSGPGWESFFLPIVVVASIAATQPIVNFIRPEWTRFRSVVRILADLALVVIFSVSLGTGQWIQPTDGAAAPADVVSLASEINRWVGVSLAVATLITAAMAGFELVRLVRRVRSDLAPSRSI